MGQLQTIFYYTFWSLSFRQKKNFETSGIILATFAVVLACALMGCMEAATDFGGVIGDNGSDSFSGRRSWSPDALPGAPDTHPELPQPPTWTVAPWTVAPWIVGPGDGGDPNPGGPNWGWGAGAAWPWSPHRCDPCFKPGSPKSKIKEDRILSKQGSS